MTLTVRDSSVTGAVTAGRELTHSEMDANWAHVIESSNQNFTPSGTGAASRTVSEVLQENRRRRDYDTEAYYQTAKVRAKPTNFSFVPGTIFECNGPGRARHDIDLELEFRNTYSSQMSNPDQIDFSAGKFVDVVNGSDANAGTFAAPYLTIRKAVQNVTDGMIWILPGDGTARLDVREADNYITGTTPRAIFIKALGGPGSVTLRAAGDQPSAMTWTLSGSVYTATPSGSELVNHIIYKENGRKVDLDYQADAASVTGTAKGWYQDATTKLITVSYRGLNIESNKAKFEIFYDRSAGNLLVDGGVVYVEGIDFRGDRPITMQFANSNRPVLYAKNCTWLYCGGGVDNNGGICFTQNCLIERTLNADGLNHDIDPGTSTLPQALEIDCEFIFCGVQGSRTFVATRNIQGSSAHRGYPCRINGLYEGNYGQNVADTNTNEGTWMIGTRLPSPYSETGGSEALGGFQSLSLQGTNYLDCVEAGGRGATYGLYLESGDTKTHNCSFSGTTSPVGANTGTSSTFDPYTGS